MALDFPAWLRVEHWLNVLFLTLLIRSGIEVLSTHPKLYWHDDSTPGTEWARFTAKTMPKNKLYDTLDEEEDYHPVIALPGHAQLGMGRHWHFAAVIGWILVGLSYYILLFATGQWHRHWPYSWSIFTEAWNDIVTYLSFNLPPLLPGEPLDAIQKLTCAARYVCFMTMQDNSIDEPSAHGGGQFYEVFDLKLAHKPQLLLAYAMNGEPLPIQHGAPLRLRAETQVGFKMAKWINQIEFVDDYAHIGKGRGGWREDNV